MEESATLCIMATDAEIGARLAQAREAKKLSREQLAERVGFSLATVQHHENGVRGIRKYCASLWNGSTQALATRPKGQEPIRIPPSLSALCPSSMKRAEPS